MQNVTVSRIRPISWKVFVQGESEAEYVGRMLEQAGVDVSRAEQDTTALTEPPVYVLVASPKADVPLTQEELITILKRDERVHLAFEEPE